MAVPTITTTKTTTSVPRRLFTAALVPKPTETSNNSKSIHKTRICPMMRRQHHNLWMYISMWVYASSLLSFPPCFFVVARNDDYYYEHFDDYVVNNYYNKYNNNNRNDDGGNQNNNNNKEDDDDAHAWANDDGGNNNNVAEEQNNNDAKNMNNNNNNKDDDYPMEYYNGERNDDDTFHWTADVGFDGVSIMPLSCIQYKNGHMIKFQLYDSDKSMKCHVNEIGTFVVSIAHFMRAYFNYQALQYGQDFVLPDDVAFLNCNRIQLQGENAANMFLYGKIGCMEHRSLSTSTKLRLHLYYDRQCSRPYDDGGTARDHSSKGYYVSENIYYGRQEGDSSSYDVSNYKNAQLIKSYVSFKVPFYHCHSCLPENGISGTFNKRNKNWYDDDYISQNGQAYSGENKNNNNHGNNNNNQGNVDDVYLASNDDINYDDARFSGDDKYQANRYNYNGGGGRRRRKNQRALQVVEQITAKPLPKVAEAYEKDFWNEYNYVMAVIKSQENRSSIAVGLVETRNQSQPKLIKQRALAQDNEMYDIGDWNMCQRLYKYGVYCDEECRELDFFSHNEWSAPDIFLLSIMLVFFSAMVALVVHKRHRAIQRAEIYMNASEMELPGLPHVCMAILFLMALTAIITLASLKFINETLLLTIACCALVFAYMLKLTLCENKRPVLLAAPKHDLFDNPLDDHLFD